MTALAVTPQAGSVAAPPAMLLQVTGAPGKPVSAYASSFTAGVDSFTASGTGAAVARDATRTPNALKLTGPGNSGTRVYGNRTITTVIGVTYRVRGFVQSASGTFVMMDISGSASTASIAAPTRTLVEFTFTATATSHVLRLSAIGPHATITAWVDTITVDPATTWQGTRIRRTDVNGTAYVRLDPGQDVPTGGSTMTVRDYEAALVGAVSYTVTDGNGGTATAGATHAQPAGVWLTLPATSTPSTTPPQFVELDTITDYSEDSDSIGTLHTILGRADKVANPSVMTMRSGTVTLWCATWDDARAVRLLLDGGEIAQLRQPELAGFDMYLYASKVSLAPQNEETETRRWGAVITFDEVLAP